jgi:hypothetical protein
MGAEKSAVHYEELCVHHALPILLNGILAKDTSFSRVVVENALSAVARICSAYKALGNPNISEDIISTQIVSLWLPLLPPREDSEEAPVIIDWLLERCDIADSLNRGVASAREDRGFDKTIPSGHALYVLQDALKISEMGGSVQYSSALLERMRARVALLQSSLPVSHLEYARSKGV